MQAARRHRQSHWSAIVNYRALLVAFGFYIATPLAILLGMLISTWWAQ